MKARGVICAVLLISVGVCGGEEPNSAPVPVSPDDPSLSPCTDSEQKDVKPPLKKKQVPIMGDMWMYRPTDVVVGVGAGLVTGGAVLMTPVGPMVAAQLGALGLLGNMGPATLTYIMAEKLTMASVVSGFGVSSVALFTSRVSDRIWSGPKYYPEPKVEVRVVNTTTVKTVIKEVEVFINQTCPVIDVPTSTPTIPVVPPPHPVEVGPVHPVPVPAHHAGPSDDELRKMFETLKSLTEERRRADNDHRAFHEHHQQQLMTFLAIGSVVAFLLYIVPSLFRKTQVEPQAEEASTSSTPRAGHSFSEEIKAIQNEKERSPQITVPSGQFFKKIQDICKQTIDMEVLAELVQHEVAKIADSVTAVEKKVENLDAASSKANEENHIILKAMQTEAARERLTLAEVSKVISQAAASTNKKLDTVGTASGDVGKTLSDIKAALEVRKAKSDPLVTMNTTLQELAKGNKTLLKACEGMKTSLAEKPGSALTADKVGSVVKEAIGKSTPEETLALLNGIKDRVEGVAPQLLNVLTTQVTTLSDELKRTSGDVAHMKETVDDVGTKMPKEHLTGSAVADIVKDAMEEAQKASNSDNLLTEMKKAIDEVSEKLPEEHLTGSAVADIVKSTMEEAQKASNDDLLTEVKKAIDEVGEKLPEEHLTGSAVVDIVKDAMKEAQKTSNRDLLTEVEKAIDEVGRKLPEEHLTGSAVADIVKDAMEEAQKADDDEKKPEEHLTKDDVARVVKSALEEAQKASNSDNLLTEVKKAIDEVGKKLPEEHLTETTVTDIVKGALEEAHKKLDELRIASETLQSSIPEEHLTEAAVASIVTNVMAKKDDQKTKETQGVVECYQEAEVVVKTKEEDLCEAGAPLTNDAGEGTLALLQGIKDSVLDVLASQETVDNKLNNAVERLDRLPAEHQTHLTESAVADIVKSIIEEAQKASNDDLLTEVKKAIDEVGEKLPEEPLTETSITVIIKAALEEAHTKIDTLNKRDAPEGLTADSLREVVGDIVTTQVEALSKGLQDHVTETSREMPETHLTRSDVSEIVTNAVNDNQFTEMKKAIDEVIKKLPEEHLTGLAMKDIVKGAVEEAHSKIDALHVEKEAPLTAEGIHSKALDKASIQDLVESIGVKVETLNNEKEDKLLAEVMKAVDMVIKKLPEEHLTGSAVADIVKNTVEEAQKASNDDLLTEVKKAIDEVGEKLPEEHLTGSAVVDIVKSTMEEAQKTSNRDLLTEVEKAIDEVGKKLPEEHLTGSAVADIVKDAMEEAQKADDDKKMPEEHLTKDDVARVVKSALEEAQKASNSYNLLTEVKKAIDEVSEKLPEEHLTRSAVADIVNGAMEEAQKASNSDNLLTEVKKAVDEVGKKLPEEHLTETTVTDIVKGALEEAHKKLDELHTASETLQSSIPEEHLTEAAVASIVTNAVVAQNDKDASVRLITEMKNAIDEVGKKLPEENLTGAVITDIVRRVLEDAQQSSDEILLEVGNSIDELRNKIPDMTEQAIANVMEKVHEKLDALCNEHSATSKFLDAANTNALTVDNVREIVESTVAAQVATLSKELREADHLTTDDVTQVVKSALEEAQKASNSDDQFTEVKKAIDEVSKKLPEEHLTGSAVKDIVVNVAEETHRKLDALQSAREATDVDAACESLTADSVREIVEGVVTAQVALLTEELSTNVPPALVEVKNIVEEVRQKLPEEHLTRSVVADIVKSTIEEKASNDDLLTEVKKAIDEVGEKLPEEHLTGSAVADIVKDAMEEAQKASNNDLLTEVKKAIDEVGEKLPEEHLTGSAVADIVNGAMEEAQKASNSDDLLTEVKKAINEVGKKLPEEHLTETTVTDIVKGALEEAHKKLDELHTASEILQNSMPSEALRNEEHLSRVVTTVVAAEVAKCLTAQEEHAGELKTHIEQALSKVTGDSDCINNQLEKLTENLPKEMQTMCDELSMQSGKVNALISEGVGNAVKQLHDIATENNSTLDTLKENIMKMAEKVPEEPLTAVVVTDIVTGAMDEAHKKLDTLVKKEEPFSGVPVTDIVQLAIKETLGEKLQAVTGVPEAVERALDSMLSEKAIGSVMTTVINESSKLQAVMDEVAKVGIEVREEMRRLEDKQDELISRNFAEDFDTLTGAVRSVTESIQECISENNEELFSMTRQLVKTSTDNIYKSPKQEPVVIPAEQLTPTRTPEQVTPARTPEEAPPLTLPPSGDRSRRSSMDRDDLATRILNEGVDLRNDSLVSTNVKNIVKAVSDIRSKIADMDRGKLQPSEVAQLSEVSKSNTKLQAVITKLEEKVDDIVHNMQHFSMPKNVSPSVSEPDTSPAHMAAPPPICVSPDPTVTPSIRSPSIPPLKLSTNNRPLRLYCYSKWFRFREMKVMQGLLQNSRTTHRQYVEEFIDDVAAHNTNMWISRMFRKLVAYACYKKTTGRPSTTVEKVVLKKTMGKLQRDLEGKLVKMEERVVTLIRNTFTSADPVYADYRKSTDVEYKSYEEVDITPVSMKPFVKITDSPYDTPYVPCEDDAQSQHSSRSRRSSIMSYTSQEIDDILARIDKNGNGWIDAKELREAVSDRDIKELFEAKGVGSGPDQYIVERVWQKLQQAGFTNRRNISMDGLRDWVKGVTIGEYLDQQDHGEEVE